MRARGGWFAVVWGFRPNDTRVIYSGKHRPQQRAPTGKSHEPVTRPMEDTLSADTGTLAAQIAKTFIARRDVKAIQSRTGAYMPVVTDSRDPQSERLPWSMGDLMAHVDGTKTFGHYLLSKDSTCKVFCFDIDLEQHVANEDKRPVKWVVLDPRDHETLIEREGNARDFWRPERMWQWCTVCLKGWYTDFAEARCVDQDHEHTIEVGGNPDTLALTSLLQQTAFGLAAKVTELLEIPVAVSYSGNKGLHVYGLVGEQPAADVRMAANLIIGASDHYVPARGNVFFRDARPEFDPISIEVFPKQDALDGKDLGNLIRLPLGINRKSGNRGYFLKPGAYGYLTEMDAMEAMTKGMSWE